MLKDFPKIECPFVRKTYRVNKSDWKKYGSRLGLRAPEVYLVTPEVNKGYEWVFEEDTVYATEKLHGTNVCISVEDGRLIEVQNRLNPVDIFKVVGRKEGLPSSARFVEGILNASSKNLIEDNLIQYGEMIGPSINGNLHQLESHLFYPFNQARKFLRYKSFEKYPKDFMGWSNWFKTSLKSLLYCRINRISLSEMYSDPNVPFTEGIVIYRNDEPETQMAKLRRDMMDWYYGEKIGLLGLEDWRVDAAKKNGYKLKGYTE